ncbi:MAG TPA: hypothetical protein VGM90_17655 [Kofleriaceae bacterium]
MTDPTAPIDPAVRSVRIAAALCDRFEELMRGPTQVRATKARRSLIGVTGDETGLSLRLGEAQQLYPEIWRHLDDARTAFATRGTDVSGYDGLRKDEGAGMGAKVETASASYGAGRYGYDEYTKTADFNVAGLARARQAITVLVSVTPQIDWHSIIAAEAADPAVAEFTRGTRNKRIIQFSLLAAVVIAPFLIVQYLHHLDRVKRDSWREQSMAAQAPVTLSPAEVDGLAARAKVVRQNVDRALLGWPKADSIKAAVPTEKMCTVRVTPPSQAAAVELIAKGTVDDAAFSPTDFYAYSKDAPIDDAAALKADRMLKEVERDLASKTAGPSDVKLLASIAQTANLVVFDEVVQPDGPQLGHAKGTAYVFDFAAGKIVCVGSFDVTNDINDLLSDARTKVHGGKWEERLHRELELRLRMAFGNDLHGT